jgi:ribosomal protein S21
LQVKFDKGIQIVKIFKEHSSKTSILDDFGFYESREKTTQERKYKEQQLPKQVTVVLNLSEFRTRFPHLTCFCFTGFFH